MPSIKKIKMKGCALEIVYVQNKMEVVTSIIITFGHIRIMNGKEGVLNIVSSK